MFSFHGCGPRSAGVLALMLAGLLTGCASGPQEPAIRTVQVNMPTPLSCVPEAFPEAPAYPDSDQALKAAASGAERYQLIQAGRILRTQRAAEVEPVIEACRQVSPLP